MSREYFYFISGLPNISFEDTKQVLSPEQFLLEAKAQLSEHDYFLLEILHLPYDLDNLLSLLYKINKASNTGGLHGKEHWEVFIAYVSNLIENPELKIPSEFSLVPEFVVQIVLKVLQQEEKQPLLVTESEFLSGFYLWASNHGNQFVSKWYSFDSHLRNILMAINGRKYGLPFREFLVGESETNEMLAKSQASDFGIGKEDDLLEALIRVNEQNNLLHRERNYDIIRWKWIDNQNFFQYFSIDRVLGYYCKLRILARWQQADPQQGKEVFYKTLKAMEESLTFPEDFNIKSVKKH